MTRRDVSVDAVALIRAYVVDRDVVTASQIIGDVVSSGDGDVLARRLLILVDWLTTRERVDDPDSFDDLLALMGHIVTVSSTPS